MEQRLFVCSSSSAPLSLLEGGSACNFCRRLAGKNDSWRLPENPQTERRKMMCLQAEWELGQLQEMECLATARTCAFLVEPRTVKMQLTLVFMSQKGWVDAQRSLPGSTTMVIIVKFFLGKKDGC